MLVENKNKEPCRVNNYNDNGECCCNCRYMKRNFVGGMEVGWLCDVLIHISKYEGYKLKDYEGLTYLGLPEIGHMLCEMYERVGSRPTSELEIE